MSDSVRPHRRQPTRFPHPWDSPGKNTEVGCHFLLQCMKVKSESEVTESCPTFSDPMDCSPPASSVHGIFQARVLEQGAIAFSVSYRLQIRKSESEKSRKNQACSMFSLSSSFSGKKRKTHCSIFPFHCNTRYHFSSHPRAFPHLSFPPRMLFLCLLASLLCNTDDAALNSQCPLDSIFSNMNSINETFPLFFP